MNQCHCSFHRPINKYLFQYLGHVYYDTTFCFHASCLGRVYRLYFALILTCCYHPATAMCIRYFDGQISLAQSGLTLALSITMITLLYFNNTFDPFETKYITIHINFFLLKIPCTTNDIVT